MKIAYGIDVEASDDPYISLGDESMAGFSEAVIMGTFWVDYFPILKYVPSWFPGAGFQKKAARWREVNASLTEKPFCHAKEQLVGVFQGLMSLSKPKFGSEMAKLGHR